jgi:tRNA-dihydrouridine synthase
LSHLALFAKVHGERKAAADLKKHISWYVKGLPCAATMRTKIFHSATAKALQEILESAF